MGISVPHIYDLQIFLQKLKYGREKIVKLGLFNKKLATKMQLSIGDS